MTLSLFFDFKNCISSVKTAIRKAKWKNVGMGMNHFTRSCRRHTLFLLYAPLPCTEDLCVQPHVRPTRGSALDRKNRYLCEKVPLFFSFIFFANARGFRRVCLEMILAMCGGLNTKTARKLLKIRGSWQTNSF